MTLCVSPIDRLFTETGAECRDDLGFLDVGRTRLFRFEDILAEPLAWVLGPPWIGKSTVATTTEAWLRTETSALGGVEHRHWLTRLGTQGAGYEIPPRWWAAWCGDATPWAARPRSRSPTPQATRKARSP